MIVELFYPKELKEIIRTLEAEDNLHREPLKLYKALFSTGIFCTLCAIFLGLISQNLYIILLHIIISCIGLMYYLKYCFSTLKAYVYGDKHSGKIIKMYTGFFFRGTCCRSAYNFVCETETNQKRVILRGIPQDIIDHYKLSIGSTVMFWQSAEHRTIAVPDFEEIKIDYGLRKDLINKNT